MKILRWLFKVVVLELKGILELPTEDFFRDRTLVVSLVLYQRFHTHMLKAVVLGRKCAQPFKPIRIAVSQWHRKLIIAM
jgi:hypothetical protein